MEVYKWRTAISGAIYIDSMTGSDDVGDGSRQNPYKSLRRAGNASIIVCRGLFSEDMADGNHSRTIRGDYMGAAIFDGQDQYVIYGFTHVNFVIINCPPGGPDLNVNTGSGLLAGAGRANNAFYVGSANNVYGVAGSPVILHKTGVYMGVIGGSSAVVNNIFSDLRCNDSYKLSLGGNSTTLRENVYYDMQIENRQKRVTSGNQIIYDSIFAKFDIFVDDSGITLYNCLITSDCRFFWGETEIQVTGLTSEQRRQSLLSGMTAAGVPTSGRTIFTNCIFSTQSAYDVFNNPDELDFSTKAGSDAIVDATTHLGAIGPGINIPFHVDSDGEINCWETRSIAGSLEIIGHELHINPLDPNKSGEIFSKVIRINNAEVNISGVISNFFSRFNSSFAYLNEKKYTGLEYAPQDLLPEGKYVVKGNITYQSVVYGMMQVVTVAASGTTFTDNDSGSVIVAIDDPNINNVLYLREANYALPLIGQLENLESGGVYFNHGIESIVYRGRTIAPGESFVAENSVDKFSGTSGYEISIAFDDTRVPQSDWIPAQIYGDYFVWKENGVVQKDPTGLPISSGNVLAHIPEAEGGYSDVLIPSPMRSQLFQLKIKLRRH